MILERLTLENFGQYAGEHTFDLSPQCSDRPVILFKGHNGAGKTTLLDALRLALFGRRSLGERVGRKDYEAYLLRRINRLASERFAKLSLSFSLKINGRKSLFEVERSWTARGNSVVDSFHLICDGEEPDDLLPEEWESYVAEILPPGLSQLFLFDGEKIQDIAEDHKSEAVRHAIRNLLGLDLAGQLITDLAHYAARSRDDKNERRLEDAFVERDSLTAAIRSAEEEVADLRSERDQRTARVRRAEEAFQSGGVPTHSLGEAKAVRREIQQRYEELLAELRNAAGGILPLALAPNTVAALQGRLKSDRAKVPHSAVLAFIDRFRNQSGTNDKHGGPWTERHFADLRDFANRALSDEGDPITQDVALVEGRLAALGASKRSIAYLAQELEENRLRHNRLEEQIEAFEVGEAVDALESLKLAEHERGAIEQTLARSEEGLRDLRIRFDKCKDTIERLQEEAFANAANDRAMDLAKRIKQALGTYEVRLLESYLGEIETAFLEIFDALMRKENFLERVTIDKESFEFVLTAADGTRLDRADLSAGERQLFAIAMLSALANVSGRALPMVIDTPLSRLDATHRARFLKHLIRHPTAQLILLCTDTELTSNLEQMIESFVSRSYVLSAPRDGETVLGGGKSERGDEGVYALQ